MNDLGNLTATGYEIYLDKNVEGISPVDGVGENNTVYFGTQIPYTNDRIRLYEWNEDSRYEFLIFELTHGMIFAILIIVEPVPNIGGVNLIMTIVELEVLGCIKTRLISYGIQQEHMIMELLGFHILKLQHSNLAII